MGRETYRLEHFVGREQELRTLRSHAEEASNGHGRMVLIGGEPGIGKTRLATEFGRSVSIRGTPIFWGRCWEDQGAPPFWPWAQILRAYFRNHAPPEETLPLESPALAQLLPELISSTAIERRATHSLRAFSNEERFRLFDTASNLLLRTARDHPSLIILDDIHWADPLSLLFADFLLDEIRNTPILLLATYRTSELKQGTLVQRYLIRLLRHRELVQLNLTGLSRLEAAQLLPIKQDHPISHELLSQIYARTRGNPFFLVELLRALPNVQDPLALTQPSKLPHTLLALVDARLRPISDACRQFLSCASVIGQDFDIPTLVKLSPSSPESTRRLLDEAHQNGLLITWSDHPGTCSFSHAIIRDALYLSLPPSIRGTLHITLAGLLEHELMDGDDTLYSAVSHHYFHALETHQEANSKALDYALVAGGAAVDASAYEDAVLHYRRALKLLPPIEQTRRGDVLVALGNALTHSGDWQAAEQVFEDAFGLGQRLSSPGLIGRAAIGLKGMGRGTLPPNLKAINALRFALQNVTDDQAELRAQLTTALSTALYFADKADRDTTLSAQAVQLATRCADHRVLGDALEAHVFDAWHPNSIAEMLHRANALLETGIKHNDNDLVFRARISRYVALSQLADPLAKTELLLCDSLVRRLRNPRYLWQVQLARASQALLSGNLEAATALAEQTHLLGRRFHDPTADYHLALHRFSRARLCGTLRDVSNIFEPTIAAAPEYPLPRIAYGYYLATIGEFDLAHRTVAAIFEAPDGKVVPMDAFYLLTICVLADTISVLGDRTYAQRVKTMLLPFSDQIAICGWGSAIEGAVSHFVGSLHVMLGSLPEAKESLEHAIVLNGAAGFQLPKARSATLLAHVLLELFPDSNLESARELLGNVLEIHKRYGLVGRTADTQTLIDALATKRPLQDAPTPQTFPLSFRIVIGRGEFTTIETMSTQFRIRTGKGLRQLAELVSNPGKEFPAIYLACIGEVAAQQGENSKRIARPSEGKATILDQRAISEYRERLRNLRCLLEEARGENNIGQANAYQTEIGWLENTLVGAIGIRGRRRTIPDAAERARISVRNNLSNTMNRIGRFDQNLADHLRRSLRTGIVCTYSPLESMTGAVQIE